MKKGLPKQFLLDYAEAIKNNTIKESNDNFILKLIKNATE